MVFGCSVTAGAVAVVAVVVFAVAVVVWVEGGDKVKVNDKVAN